MKAITVGLLPLYLKLYDDTSPQYRPGVERFRDTIAAELQKRGLSVVTAPVCRIASEFQAAVQTFEAQQVTAIVTLHLAYSPSQESVPAIAATQIPVIVLDTTPALDFGPRQSPDEIMYNHGIHGVQDFCNLLIRHGKGFQIEAGHWQRSDVLDRVVMRAQAAALAQAMRTARVGRIGNGFKGMGDFDVPESVMAATIGITAVRLTPEGFGTLATRISDDDIAVEVVADRVAYTLDGVSPEAHALTARVGLAVRQWIAQEGLTAFTLNFMEATRGAGVPAMPFLEASKAMARGIGYAGEGDVLTAALVGALGSVYPRVTFTEMFCPDWANDTIFLSHMGEMNIDLIDGTPRLVQKSYAFIDSADPILSRSSLRQSMCFQWLVRTRWPIASTAGSSHASQSQTSLPGTAGWAVRITPRWCTAMRWIRYVLSAA
jgi:L-arabinose isomerase